MPQAAKEKERQFSVYKTLAKMRDARDPAWLVNLRDKAGERFAALDFPTTRDEAWKYTNVAPLVKTAFCQTFELDLMGVTPETIEPFTYAETRQSQLVFVNGLYAAELSNLNALPGALTACNLAGVPTQLANIVRKHLATQADYFDHTFTALNTANLNDGALVYLPRGQACETPIHLLFLTTAQQPSMAHPRALIVAEAGALATIVESYASLDEGAAFTNAVTEVVAQAGAVVTHYRLQAENEQSFHIATTEVAQERGSNYTSCAITLGAALARHDLNLKLADENCEATIDGLYAVTGNQHCDNHTTIDHAQPRCASRQTYKGILNGKARAVFNGIVYVREGALLTDARQFNKNLLLSDEAHVDTKPQLEIFADDVKCAHGATVGQLEDEELFYLAARGIGPERARALLTYGFAEDIISKIKLPSVHKALDRAVLEKLHQSLEVE
jgi:Fe-S cluster assembly protein SufD